MLLSPALAWGQNSFFHKGTWKALTHFWISFGSYPGGADKNVVVFDKSSEQILATLKGHTKKVTSVVFHPSQVRCSHSHTWSPFLSPVSQWFRVPEPVAHPRCLGEVRWARERALTPERAHGSLRLESWGCPSLCKAGPSDQGGEETCSLQKHSHRNSLCWEKGTNYRKQSSTNPDLGLRKYSRGPPGRRAKT